MTAHRVMNGLMLFGGALAVAASLPPADAKSDEPKQPAQSAVVEQNVQEPATAGSRDPEITAAIKRLRDRGAFVREFHPRGNPQYWVQIISTGSGETARDIAENFDDAAMNDVEII